MCIDSCQIARRAAAVICLAVLLTAFAGCGQSRPPVEIAGGRVICGGAAVAGGSITFMPAPIDGEGNKEPGKAAKAEVAEDGSFRLTTFETFDGAVVGRHRVSYEAPEGGDEEEDAETSSESEQEAAPSRPKKTARPVYHIQGELLVEVKAGESNTFVIELAPGRGPSEESE